MKLFKIDTTANTFEKGLESYTLVEKKQTGWTLTRDSDGEQVFAHLLVIKDNYFIDEDIARVEYMIKNQIDSFDNPKIVK